MTCYLAHENPMQKGTSVRLTAGVTVRALLLRATLNLVALGRSFPVRQSGTLVSHTRHLTYQSDCTPVGCYTALLCGSLNPKL